MAQRRERINQVHCEFSFRKRSVSKKRRVSRGERIQGLIPVLERLALVVSVVVITAILARCGQERLAGVVFIAGIAIILRVPILIQTLSEKLVVGTPEDTDRTSLLLDREERPSSQERNSSSRHGN